VWRLGGAAPCGELEVAENNRAGRKDLRHHQPLQKSLKSVGCHVGVPDRVLNVFVPEVVLQGARVVAIVGQLKPTGMAKHVWVDREWHRGGLADALDEAVEPNRTNRPAALGNEYVGVFGVITA